jgi:hypothetical protein
MLSNVVVVDVAVVLVVVEGVLVVSVVVTVGSSSIWEQIDALPEVNCEMTLSISWS